MVVVQGHAPAKHFWPPGQTCPQPPQLLPSVWVFVQVPAQRVSPAGHTHEPPLQVVPLLQTCPPCPGQPPQLVLEVWVFVQTVPHSVVPPLHAQLPF
jgi:hypothetical protein